VGGRDKVARLRNRKVTVNVRYRAGDTFKDGEPGAIKSRNYEVHLGAWWFNML
jgi:hypothetical protein